MISPHQLFGRSNLMISRAKADEDKKKIQTKQYRKHKNQQISTSKKKRIKRDNSEKEQTECSISHKRCNNLEEKEETRLIETMLQAHEGGDVSVNIIDDSERKSSSQGPVQKGQTHGHGKLLYERSSSTCSLEGSHGQTSAPDLCQKRYRRSSLNSLCKHYGNETKYKSQIPYENKRHGGRQNLEYANGKSSRVYKNYDRERFDAQKRKRHHRGHLEFDTSSKKSRSSSGGIATTLLGKDDLRHCSTEKQNKNLKCENETASPFRQRYDTDLQGSSYVGKSLEKATDLRHIFNSIRKSENVTSEVAVENERKAGTHSMTSDNRIIQIRNKTWLRDFLSENKCENLKHRSRDRRVLSISETKRDHQDSLQDDKPTSSKFSSTSKTSWVRIGVPADFNENEETSKTDQRDIVGYDDLLIWGKQ